MRSLHLEKNGIRGLAISESFRQDSEKSVLAGIIMSNDFVIDGFVFGNTTIKAVESKGLRVDISAPTKETPSMSMALQRYIKKMNKK